MPRKKAVVTLLLIAVVVAATLLFALRDRGGRRYRIASQASPAKGKVVSSKKANFRFLGHTISLEDEGWMNASALLKKEPMRDPFAVPLPQKKLSVSPSEPEKKETREAEEAREFPPIELKAIIIGEQENMAIVGGEVVSVGSKIGEEEVLAIEEDRILVGAEGYQREVSLTTGGSNISITRHSSEDLFTPERVIKK